MSTLIPLLDRLDCPRTNPTVPRGSGPQIPVANLLGPFPSFSTNSSGQSKSSPTPPLLPGVAALRERTVGFLSDRGKPPALPQFAAGPGVSPLGSFPPGYLRIVVFIKFGPALIRPVFPLFTSGAYRKRFFSWVTLVSIIGAFPLHMTWLSA